jgi:hypothetical protein
MPNHVTNILKISGDYKLIEQCRKEIKGSKRAIDFNKIKPMPKVLQGTTSPTRIVTKAERDVQLQAVKTYKASGNKNPYDKPRVDLTAKMAKECRDKYGATDWYDWAVHNWGTKWNAYSIESRSYDVIKFETAWSLPFDLYVALSAKYPKLVFTVEYADEDIGSNCGVATFKNGIGSINEKKGDADYAYAVTGRVKYFEEDEA